MKGRIRQCSPGGKPSGRNCLKQGDTYAAGDFTLTLTLSLKGKGILKQRSVPRFHIRRGGVKLVCKAEGVHRLAKAPRRSPMNSLGRVAIVTGAGSGVGRASALALLRDGSLGGACRTQDRDAGGKPGGGGDRGRRAPGSRDRRDHRRRQPGVGGRSVRPLPRGLRWSPRRAVQQRRQLLASGEHGGPDLRAVDDRGQRQPYGHLPVYTGGLQGHERPGPHGRAHYQQRLHRRLRASPQQRPVHRHQARRGGPDQGRPPRWTGASTTSPAARSTSAMPPPT